MMVSRFIPSVGTIKRSLLLSLTRVTQHTSLPPRSNTYSACSLVGFWNDKPGWCWFVVREKHCWLADKPWLKPTSEQTDSLLSRLSNLRWSQYSYVHRHPREQAFKTTMSAANLHGWWAIMVFGSAKFWVTAHCSTTFRHALQYIVVRLLPDIPIHCIYYFLVNVRDTAL